MAPLKDIMMATLMVHLIGTNWNMKKNCTCSSDGASHGLDLELDEGTELDYSVNSSEAYNDGKIDGSLDGVSLG